MNGAENNPEGRRYQYRDAEMQHESACFLGRSIPEVTGNYWPTGFRRVVRFLIFFPHTVRLVGMSEPSGCYFGVPLIDISFVP